jgi:hypothetical protein
MYINGTSAYGRWRTNLIQKRISRRKYISKYWTSEACPPLPRCAFVSRLTQCPLRPRQPHPLRRHVTVFPFLSFKSCSTRQYISFPLQPFEVRQMSQDVPSYAGFLSYKAVMLGRMTRTSLYKVLTSLNTR